MKEKAILRRDILGRLRRQTARARREKSARILQRLCRMPLYRRARRVLCYVSIEAEVQTGPLLDRIVRDGKKLAVPVTLKNHRLVIAAVRHPARELTRMDLFGIPVPDHSRGRSVHRRALDMVLVPGVAFDPYGGRLGRGRGYYDRFLARLPRSIPRVGLAFECQMIPKVPARWHDERMQAVVTEKKSYENPDRR